MTFTANFKQGRIFYTVKGEGRAVIFLHGFLETSKIWDEMAKELSKNYKVICIDLPGHGKSDCYGYIHTMELMAQSVKKVADELKLRKFVLIGHSMGGYVSLSFAELYPDNVRGLVLFHSTALPDNEDKKIERDRAITAVKKSSRSFVKGAIERLFNPNNADVYKKEILHIAKEASKMSKQAIIDCLEGMKIRLNREMILQYSNYPVLFILGKHDQLISFEKVMEQTSLPKKSYKVILTESGHMGFIEEFEKSLKSIQQFLKIAFEKYENSHV